MSNDPLKNPYAPPAEVTPEPEEQEGEGGRRRRRRVDFSPERRSVVVVLLLTIVTFGVYNTVWLWRRRAFIDSLDTGPREKLGRAPEVLGAMWVGMLILTVVFGSTTFTNAYSSAMGIGVLVSCFTVARALRTEIARTGRAIAISSVLVFFLGVAYLQYKINEIADTPARRKKRRKEASAEAGEAPLADDETTT